MPMNKDRAYNCKEESEKAEHEMREKEKCLENGEQAEENGGGGGGGAKEKRSRLENFTKGAKSLTTRKSLIVIVLLCVLLIIFFIIIIALAVQIGYLRKRNEPYVCETAECLRSASHAAANLNATIDPCNDFWTFACGNWLEQNRLPDRKGSYSVTDSITDDVNWKLRHLIDLVPEDTEVRDPRWKVKRFYGVCMDVKTVEYAAFPKLKDIISQMEGWILTSDWAPQKWDRDRVMERLQTEYGVTPFFKISVEPDDRAPSTSIIKIFPSGLGLPSRHYYHKASNSKYEEAYKKLLNNFARQLRVTASEASQFATLIFGYEKRLAEITPPPEAYRKPEVYYKKLSVAELAQIAPSIPWLRILQNYLPRGRIEDVTEIAIFDEKYFQGLSAIVSSTDNTALHHYLLWHLALKYIPHLSTDYRKMANEFNHALDGVQNSFGIGKDRWEYCLDLSNKYFGYALGAMYVKAYYEQDYNDEVRLIEEQIQSVFRNHVGNLPWTEDSQTTEIVKEKVTKMLSLRGSPDFIDVENAFESYYDDFSVQSNFMENIFTGERFLRGLKEKMIGKPVNSENRWNGLSPQEASSVYNYIGNSLVIPAGLLQLPIFNPPSPNAIKYGSLGTVLGSQLFKAFDEKGIMYEKLGVLSPWLIGPSAKQYLKESTCLKEKVGNETIYGNIHANADLVLGEAIADLAAVKIAFKAYKDSSHGGLDLPGLKVTNDELFFISYAQSMCENIRLDKVLAQNDYSVSSANQLRVLRTLKQLPEFSEVFECSSGSPMNPKNKCHMW